MNILSFVREGKKENLQHMICRVIKSRRMNSMPPIFGGEKSIEVGGAALQISNVLLTPVSN